MRLPKVQGFGKAGFSLVEVTLAMGIAAVGLVAVLGMLPQGLEMSQKTSELSAHRQITEHIVRNLEQKSWSDLIGTGGAGGATLRAYFDDQGLEVLATSPTIVFVAEVQVLPLTGTKVILPSGSTGESYLVKALMKIATSTNSQFDFTTATNRSRYVTSIDYIAKLR